MATAIKALRSLQASASNAAGGTTTSGTWDLHTAINGVLHIKITNGATGPTVACQATVNISGDGVNWLAERTLTATVGANDVNSWAVPLESGVAYAQVVFTGNTGQAVTVQAFGLELSSIG